MNTRYNCVIVKQTPYLIRKVFAFTDISQHVFGLFVYYLTV